jgi:hypothetical protein
VTLQKSGEACAPLLALRQVRGEAMRRDSIDAELRDLAAEIGRLPAVTVADPQADTAARLARWLTAGLAPITPDDVAMARIAGIAFLPQVGGLVVMLTMALWPGGSQGCMRFRLFGGPNQLATSAISEGLAVPFKCGATRRPKTPKPWCAAKPSDLR